MIPIFGASRRMEFNCTSQVPDLPTFCRHRAWSSNSALSRGVVQERSEGHLTSGGNEKRIATGISGPERCCDSGSK